MLSHSIGYELADIDPFLADMSILQFYIPWKHMEAKSLPLFSGIIK